jgi:glycosyltransferase involved in cell wall biosynthesis
MPLHRKLKYSILLPAFQEGRHVTKTIQATFEVFQTLGEDFEIIVVDDCSTDNTLEVLRALQKKIPQLQFITLPCNQGKGHALRTGFQNARGEWIFFLDADMELHPRHCLILLGIRQSQGTQVVIGSKRHPQSVLHYPWDRRLMSSVYFWLVKIVFGLPVRDTQTGIKLFHRKVLEKIFPKILVKKFAFDLELLVLAHHAGFRIAEAPVVLEDQGNFSHIRPRDVFNILWDTLAVFYRLYLLRTYDDPKQKSENSRQRKTPARQTGQTREQRNRPS